MRRGVSPSSKWFVRPVESRASISATAAFLPACLASRQSPEKSNELCQLTLLWNQAKPLTDQRLLLAHVSVGSVNGNLLLEREGSATNVDPASGLQPSKILTNPIHTSSVHNLRNLQRQ